MLWASLVARLPKALIIPRGVITDDTKHNDKKYFTFCFYMKNMLDSFDNGVI